MSITSRMMILLVLESPIVAVGLRRAPRRRSQQIIEELLESTPSRRGELFKKAGPFEEIL